MIMIGVNKGSSDKAKAYIDGDLTNPMSESGSPTLAIIIVLLLVAIAIGTIFYFKHAKSKAAVSMNGRSASVATGLATGVNDTLDEGLVTETLDDDNIQDKHE